MTEEIVNGDLAHGIPLLIQRPGVKDPLEIVVKPEQLGGKPTIGVFSSSELKLVNEKNVLPFEPESAAANAKGPLHARRSHRADRRPADRQLRPASRFPGRSRR